MLISIRRLSTTRFSSAPHRPQPPFSLHLFSSTTSQPNPSTAQEHHQHPSAAIQTLKTHGFTDTQITSITRKAPWISSLRSPDPITSKLTYLSTDLGLPEPDVAKIITSDPEILHRDLETTIIPSFNYLESLFGSRPDSIRAIARAPRLLRCAHGTLAANVSVLQDLGVSDQRIAKLLLLDPRIMQPTPRRFRELTNDVLSERLDPSRPMFVHALRVRLKLSTATWEKKVEAFTSSGWSAEEARLVFENWPLVYTYSAEKIKKVLGFLMDVAKLSHEEVLRRPMLMTCSLEMTLVPRCRVLNLLMARGVLKKHKNVANALGKTKQSFVRVFVDKYRDDVPEVVDAYEGKMEFLGFDHHR